MAAYLGLPSDFGLNVKPTPYFRPAGIKLILKNIAKSLLYWNRLDPSSALARKHLFGYSLGGYALQTNLSISSV